ncbi:BLUF domain-containing protein [Frondihabitans australicus]|uniref:FAD-dependent sensor of blue light n=1 Tax=Frondihabitans australicus TaxID=386892 RepID=A0A495II67_9MICO|nr:BLUF domain-containing protein [Frondihabitans australicus]RKR74805.1 FAD-dependent sensor of blue light [Frondihabitans australicus]
MLLLAYSSTASYDFTDGDLITLLMNSRANNRRDGITGLLLHDQGRFLQILEGDPETVRGRYDMIRDDPRHHDVTLVAEQAEPGRQFPKWSMGYTALNDPLVRSIPGFSNSFQEDTPQRSGAVTALLDHFRNGDELTAFVESE